MSQTPAATTSNSNYQFIFDNALEAYKKKTKKDLRSHPLLAKLHACKSPDAVLTILREQIDQSRGADSADGRLTSWLNPTVNVLYTFSVAVGGCISLVSIRRFGLICPRSDICCYAGVPTCGSDLHWDRRSSLSEYLDSVASTTITPPSQTIKAVSASRDALINVFERIENFFLRLETYVKVPPTAGMTDIIMKIMIEVLSILAIATKETKEGRTSEPMSCCMNRDLDLWFFRKICEKAGWENRYRGYVGSTGSIDPRGSSDGGCARFESHP